MLIISGTDISYSVNDSFQLTISSDSDFDSGTNAEIIIKSDETAEDVIDKRFAASGGVIEITLSESDRQRLSEGDYIYKIKIQEPDGTVTTVISGEFRVKWGAY